MSKEAMKLALNKAFQLGQRYWSWADSEYSSHWKKADAAKFEFDQLVQDTINAALAEQPAQQEPWGACVYGRVFVGRLPEHARKFSEDEGVPIQWLYTSPQSQRKPLTDEQREEIAKKWRGRNWTVGDIIDAIEAAHGMKEDA